MAFACKSAFRLSVDTLAAGRVRNARMGRSAFVQPSNVVEVVNDTECATTGSLDGHVGRAPRTWWMGLWRCKATYVPPQRLGSASSTESHLPAFVLQLSSHLPDDRRRSGTTSSSPIGWALPSASSSERVTNVMVCHVLCVRSSPMVQRPET